MALKGHRRHDYSRGGRRNPFKIQEKGIGQYKTQILLAVFLCCILVTIGILFFHSRFHINLIEVNGSIRIPEGQIADVAHSGLSDRKYFLPAKSFFSVSEDEVEVLLMEKFPLESVQVRKSFPNTLHIEIVEKISKIFHSDGKRLQFVDTQGATIESLREVFEYEWVSIPVAIASTTRGTTTSTESIVMERQFSPDVSSSYENFGRFPYIYTALDHEVSPEMVDNATVWYRVFSSITELEYHYQHADAGIAYTTIYTQSGPRVLLPLDQNNQLLEEALINFVAQEGERLQNYEYIDLRYVPAVYWK